MTGLRLSDRWSCQLNPADRAFACDLSLDVDKVAEELYEWVHLGDVPVDAGEGGVVTVEVSYAPSVFWRFTIRRRGIDGCIPEKPTETLATGSGRLADYWPVARMFATGMMVVER